MATFTGTIAPSGTGQYRTDHWPDGFTNRTLNRWTLGTGADLSVKPVPGAFTDNAPVPNYPTQTRSGRVSCSWFDDFYNRIYILPGSIDFGAVTNDVSRSFTIWNAYLTTVTLSDITVNDGDGLQLTGPSVPLQFLPFASHSYDVTALAEGPATIDAEYSLVFQVVGTYVLPVSGSRAQLWPFVPNWDQPYRVIYEYKTDILESHSGKEQRRALRQTPRKRLEHRATLTSAVQLRKFKQLMAYWQHRTWVMPERTRFVDASAGMPANGLTMGFDAVPFWAVPELQVVLEHQGHMEIRVIDAVTATEMTFTGATETVWPTGTRVYYGLTGYLEADLQAPRKVNSVAEVSVVFRAAPGIEPVLPVPDPQLLLAGREVFLKKPNWANQVSVQNQHPVTQIDYEIGRIARFYPIDFGTIVRQATYVNRSRDDAQLLLDLYDRMFGQQGEFYMPSGEADMVVVVDVDENTSSLRVEGHDIYTAYADDTVHKAIAVQLKDGTVLLQQVVNMVTTDDEIGKDTILEMATPWSQAFTVDQILMVSWMPVWRLASDGLTIEWLTNDTAQTQLSMKSLEDLPVEVL